MLETPTRSPARRAAWVLAIVAGSIAPGTGLRALQEVAPTTAAERRALEHAERLRDVGRLEEARRVLEALMEAEPASLAGLSALFRVAEETGELEGFLPVAERAATAVGSSSSLIRRLWIGGLLGVGRADSARAVARRWVADRPTERGAHAELAAVESAAGRPGDAIEALISGRASLEDPTAFPHELAELYAEVGDLPALAGEWLTILETERDGGTIVFEAAQGLTRDPTPALERLWVELRQDVGPRARREGIVLALRGGQTGLARELAETSLSESNRSEHRSLLESYAAEARNAEFPEQVAWAAAELAELASDRAERLRWRAEAADMALRAADTASARRSFEALRREAEPGSAAHRVATRRLFSLLAGDPEQVSPAERLLGEYRRLYRDSTLVLARMATELSRGYVRAGRSADAWRVLDGEAAETDPSAFALLEGHRGLLALYDGEVEEAARRFHLPAAAAGLDPTERARWISALAVVQQADSLEGALLGELLYELARAPASFSGQAAIERWEAAPEEELRSGSVALVALELGTAGRPEEAARLRRYLVERFPEGPEAAGAMLDLARSMFARDPEGARGWLERLITSYPDSAVAPIARRLLADLGSRASG